jgi:hypothetical protein
MPVISTVVFGVIAILLLAGCVHGATHTTDQGELAESQRAHKGG